jgi:hypothetical protein
VLLRFVNNKASIEKVPKGFWSNTDNQRKFLDALGKELGVKEVPTNYSLLYVCSNISSHFIVQLSDWYRVTRQTVKDKGGRGLFHYYPSLGKALEAIYPQFSWELSKFMEVKAPYGFWQDKEQLRHLIDEAELKLGIQKVI